MTKILCFSMLAAFLTSAVQANEISALERLHDAELYRDFTYIVGSEYNKPEKGSLRFVLQTEIDGRTFQMLSLGEKVVNGKTIHCLAHINENEVLEPRIHTLKLNPSKMGGRKATVLKFHTDDVEMKSKVVCTAKEGESSINKPAAMISITQSDLESFFVDPVKTNKEEAINYVNTVMMKGPGMHLWEDTNGELLNKTQKEVKIKRAGIRR